MKETTLTEREDIKWLVSTHLKVFATVNAMHPSAIKVAVVCGNEDCPQEVRLYAKDHWRSIPLVFKADEQGDLKFIPEESVRAGKLRPLTRTERRLGLK